MELSNLIGKEIYSIYETTSLGTISQALFNKKRTAIMGFYFFDNEENEYFVKLKNIYGFNDFVTVKNMDKVSKSMPDYDHFSPLRKKVIKTNGTYLGEICDVEIEINGKIVNYKTTCNNSINCQNIITMNDVVICDDEKQIKHFRPKSATIMPNANYTSNLNVKIMRLEPDTEPLQQLMPPKVTISTQLLIGKKMKEDLLGKNNELLLKKNQTITEKSIHEIIKHNKLNQLYHLAY